MVGRIVIPGNCLFGQGSCAGDEIVSKRADVMSAEGSGTAVEDLVAAAEGGRASGHGSSYR